MNTTINIFLAGRNIVIEDTAYRKFQSYIERIRASFTNEEERNKVIAGTEARFSEKMHNRISNGAEFVTEKDVEEMIAAESFDMADKAGEKAREQTTTGTPFNKGKRLYRDANNKIIGGVCGGLANWLNIDLTVVRILFAIITFGGFGTGIFIYLVLWIFLPAHDMEVYKGRTMFRDMDNKWLGGVVAGIGAHFKVNPNTIRGIMALPLIVTILKGGDLFGWNSGFNHFPSLVFSGITGTLIFMYIVLWIVLPEGPAYYEKKTDQGHEGQNSVKDMEPNTGQLPYAGARELSYRPQRRGLGYAIAIFFKAVFIFIAIIIVLCLLAVLFAVLSSGFAFAPANHFLWTSETQKTLAWATLLLFVGAPIAGMVVWLVRKISNIRTPGNYLNWIFGGLWAAGWVCLMAFLGSISKDFKRSETVEEKVAIQQPGNGKMFLRVSQPELNYEGNTGWLNENNNGLKGIRITNDSLSLSFVRLDFEKSEDSLYHVVLVKQALGKTDEEARNQAAGIQYNLSLKDSILDLPSGFSIGRNNRYRFQNAVLVVKVPAGKKINIDETVFDKLSNASFEFGRRNRWYRRSRSKSMRHYRPNTNYTMQEEGSLKSDDDENDIVRPAKHSDDADYRWTEEETDDTTTPTLPKTPSTGDDEDSYKESPGQAQSKETLLQELEKKEKEIEALRKKIKNK